jgi:hypothetical protein
MTRNPYLRERLGRRPIETAAREDLNFVRIQADGDLWTWR